MGIFAVAALVGFLLFGSIEASPRVRRFVLKGWVQGLLGLLALALLVWSVYVLSTLPDLEDVQSAQDLTGPEVAQLILGVAFGCILRCWWPQFWVVQMPPGTRYNWVAITLVGLLLLAATVPYLERLSGGMTGLKTPVAEFQFADPLNIDRTVFEVEREHANINLMQWFAYAGVQEDLDYLNLLQEQAETISDPSGKEDMLKMIKDRVGMYGDTQAFINKILLPLNLCTYHAYENYLDKQSIRSALRPLAQLLRLLIQKGQLQNSTLAIDTFLREAKKNFHLIKAALVEEKEKKGCEFNVDDKSPEFQKPDVLANTPHIYLLQAFLNKINDNPAGAISILESASERFDSDRNLSPGILFLINFILAGYLHDSEYDPENIYRYLDKALKIAQNAGRKIDKQKSCARLSDKLCNLLEDTSKRFEEFERSAKNALAYFSAKTGVRKLEALHYAEENYDNREKLLRPSTKPEIVDTYGYVKMAFAARKAPPDFDEIEQAKALFQQALDYVKLLPESSRKDKESKLEVKTTVQVHLEQAKKLLASR